MIWCYHNYNSLKPVYPKSVCSLFYFMYKLQKHLWNLCIQKLKCWLNLFLFNAKCISVLKKEYVTSRYDFNTLISGSVFIPKIKKWNLILSDYQEQMLSYVLLRNIVWVSTFLIIKDFILTLWKSMYIHIFDFFLFGGKMPFCIPN